MFYAQDFLTGTMFMSNEQVGIYIRLLCAQHQHGGLIDKNSFNGMVKDDAMILSKFIETDDGFFNVRLMEEMNKRAKKSKNLSDNAKARWNKYKGNAIALQKDMPTENEIEDVNEVDLINTKPSTAVKKTNDDFAKDYQDSHTQVANGIRVLKINNLRQDEENLLHLLQCFVTALNHANAKKQSFNEFTQHFTNWIGTNGAKYGLKKRAF